MTKEEIGKQIVKAQILQLKWNYTNMVLISHVLTNRQLYNILPQTLNKKAPPQAHR